MAIGAFVPTIISATASTGLPVPLNSTFSTPSSPAIITASEPTIDHFVLHRLYASAARNTVGKAIRADSASSRLVTSML